MDKRKMDELRKSLYSNDLIRREKTRILCVLLAQEGIEDKEIAQIAGISEKTALVRIGLEALWKGIGIY